MQLSADGKTIILVTNDDIQDGRFIMPSTVTAIGRAAFQGCTKLTSLSIHQDVIIGPWAFQGCTSLDELTFAEGVKIEWAAFKGCFRLTTLNIPEGVEISEAAFSECTGVTKVSLAARVTVGEDAFSGCFGITALSLSEGVSLGRGAFKGCSGITELSIPEGVRIGRNAFEGCFRLNTMSICKGVTIDDYTFSGCTELCTLNVSPSVSIGDHAFAGCIGLKVLSLAKDVTIGYKAFAECTALAELIIPEAVTLVDWAFLGCIGLTKLTLLKNVTVNKYAFSGCTGLTKLELSHDVTINGAFARCNSLTTVNIAKGAKVRDGAFYQCTGLITLTLAEGVMIDRDAFKGCTNLMRIIINSERDNELVRVKKLFLEYRNIQFMKQAWFEKISPIENRVYHHLIQEPRLSRLYGVHEHLGLVEDILPLIIAQEGMGHQAYQLFYKEMTRLSSPTNEDELDAYERQLQAIMLHVNSTILAENQRSVCVKLNGYIDTLQGLIADKTVQHPDFFSSQPELKAKLDEQIATAHDLIKYLQGDKAIRFTPRAINHLSQGFLGRTLKRFELRLAELPVEQNMQQPQSQREHDIVNLFRTKYETLLSTERQQFFGFFRRSRLAYKNPNLTLK